MRDLIALLIILAVPTVLIIVGKVGVAVIVAAAQFVVMVLRAWRQRSDSDTAGLQGGDDVDQVAQVAGRVGRFSRRSGCHRTLGNCIW